ncbi:hypothetical protein FQN54_009790 [Arachnomyces sp. PD_36]|nr:hypothetical protein FQN54_009790 [Arachnomyces sp. PD_36]
MMEALRLKEMESSEKAYAWLNVVRQCRCKDPRDKVFGLLGVFKTGIIPDYNMTTVDVYANWATNPRWNTPPGFLLSQSGIGLYPRGAGQHKTPSWLPNLAILGEQIHGWDTTYLPRDIKKTEIPIRFRASVSQASGITCYGIQLTDVCDIVIRAARRPTGYGADNSPRDRFRGITGSGRELLFPVLRYLIADRGRLWGEPYSTGESRLWAFVGPVAGCVWHRETKSEIEIAPDLLDTFCLENLLEFTKHYPRNEEERGSFSQDELAILGFPSEEEMWDTLDIPRERPSLGSKEVEVIEQLVTCIMPVVTEKSIFHTSNGLIGVGPPGTKTGDRVCLIHGSYLPVLVREVEGRIRNVGVCFVHGVGGAEGSRVLMEREGDVREINIV